MKPKRSWVVMWGSGLGDMLVIRPFLMALAKCQSNPPILLTTGRSFLPSVLQAMSLNVKISVFSNSLLGALQMVLQAPWGRPIYIGPHNTTKTRVLAYLLGLGRILHSKSKKPFIADAVADDIVLFRLAKKAAAYGPLPIFNQEFNKVNCELEDAIVVHCGAKSLWKTKCWPIDKWVQLLSLLNEISCRIILVGTEAERKQLEEIASNVSGQKPLILIHLNLSQLEHVIEMAKLVICHNSGIMHLALAHKRPSVVITGSSAHYWRAPYKWVENVVGPCDLGCNAYVCPKPELGGICIKGIEVDAVYSACMRLLT